MLKILPIISSSTSQKFTHYSYCILTSLPIIPWCFIIYVYINIQQNTALIHIGCSYCVNDSDVYT